MVSFRFASLLTLLTLGLFACAKPVPATAAVARTSDSSLIARGGACSCGQDILDVLVVLKADIDIEVALLDGHNDPADIIVKIDAAIKVAIDLLVKIKLDVFVDAEIVAAIVAILVEIILAIVGGCTKYGILIAIKLIVEIDVCIAGLLSAVIALVADVLAGLVLALQVHVDLFVSVHLVLCLHILGL